MDYQISPEKGVSDYFYTGQRENAFCLPHVHSHIEFIFVLEGKQELHIDGSDYLITENHAAIVMPYQIHHYKPKEHSTTFIIACPPEYISEYGQLFSGKVFAQPCIPFSEAERSLIATITTQESNDFFKNKALIYCILSEFLQKSTLRPKEYFSYDVYRSAIVYISEHYAEPITREQVALHANVTVTHLSRVLNSRGNASFSDIVNSLRIFRARQLLEQTKLPITRIAYETGYGSIRNFNRIFQKHFGCNPTDMRKQIAP